MKKSTIQLHDIKVENNKVIYDYSYSSDLKIYFKNKEKLYVTYDFEVSAIPKSILAIPWLANFITISWFSGCTIIIDEIDDELMNLYARRMKLAEGIGKFKKDNNIAILQTNRWNEILERGLSLGTKKGLSEEFVETTLKAIHQESINHQEKVMQGN